MLKVSHHRIPVKKNRILALIVHYVLKGCFLLYRFFSLKFFHEQEELPLKEIKKILVIRIDGLGDVVMSTPAFKALRDTFLYSHITFLAASWSKDLVEVIPTFNETIYFDAPWVVKEQKKKIIKLLRLVKKLRREKFDLAIDLRGDFRNNILMFVCKAKYRVGFNITGCHFLLTHVIPCDENHHPVKMALSLAEYLNRENKEKYKMCLWIRKEDQDFAAEFLSKNDLNDSSGDKLVIVIHPAAKWYGRQWTIEGYAAIADRLIKKYGAKVIFTGSSDEIELTQNIVNGMRYKPIIATGQTTLRQFLALLERSDLFIGVDSGPMHMATAMGTKVVAFFGPARPEAIGPYGDGHIMVTKQGEFTCSPCAQTVCKRTDYSCMKAITEEEVWKAVETQVKKILKEKNKKPYENTFN